MLALVLSLALASAHFWGGGGAGYVSPYLYGGYVSPYSYGSYYSPYSVGVGYYNRGFLGVGGFGIGGYGIGGLGVGRGFYGIGRRWLLENATNATNATKVVNKTLVQPSEDMKQSEDKGMMGDSIVLLNLGEADKMKLNQSDVSKIKQIVEEKNKTFGGKIKDDMKSLTMVNVGGQDKKRQLVEETPDVLGYEEDRKVWNPDLQAFEEDKRVWFEDGDSRSMLEDPKDDVFDDDDDDATKRKLITKKTAVPGDDDSGYDVDDLVEGRKLITKKEKADEEGLYGSFDVDEKRGLIEDDTEKTFFGQSQLDAIQQPQNKLIMTERKLIDEENEHVDPDEERKLTEGDDEQEVDEGRKLTDIKLPKDKTIEEGTMIEEEKEEGKKRIMLGDWDKDEGDEKKMLVQPETVIVSLIPKRVLPPQALKEDVGKDEGLKLPSLVKTQFSDKKDTDTDLKSDVVKPSMFSFFQGKKDLLEGDLQRPGLLDTKKDFVGSDVTRPGMLLPDMKKDVKDVDQGMKTDLKKDVGVGKDVDVGKDMKKDVDVGKDVKKDVDVGKDVKKDVDVGKDVKKDDILNKDIMKSDVGMKQGFMGGQGFGGQGFVGQDVTMKKGDVDMKKGDIGKVDVPKKDEVVGQDVSKTGIDKSIVNKDLTKGDVKKTDAEHGCLLEEKWDEQLKLCVPKICPIKEESITCPVGQHWDKVTCRCIL